jgi:hypothetical protein
MLHYAAAIKSSNMDSRLHGNDIPGKRVIPAKAGIQTLLMAIQVYAVI